jgi:two-component system, NtrC family, sensor kinase
MNSSVHTQNRRSVVLVSGVLLLCLAVKVLLAPVTIPRYIPVVAGSGICIFAVLFVIIFSFLRRDNTSHPRLLSMLLSLVLFAYLTVEMLLFFPAYYSPNRMLSYSYLCSMLIAVGLVSFAAFFFHIAVSIILFLAAIGYFILMNLLKFRNIDMLLFPILLLVTVFTYIIFNLLRIFYAQLQMERKLSRELSAAKGKIINQEKLATLATFAAGMAHEINNPLTHMYGNIEYLERHFQILAEAAAAAGIDEGERKRIGEAVQDVRRILADYRQGFARVTEIVHNMKRVFSKKSRQTDKVDLAVVLYSTIDYFEKRIRGDIHFTVSLEAPLYLNCNAGDFLSVFQILLSNSVEAIGEGEGAIWINGSKRGAELLFQIEDNGCGMSEEVLQDVFKPFFSTKGSQSNMGIGLTLCVTILEQYGGTIRIESTEGQHTNVFLAVPAGGG